MVTLYNAMDIRTGLFYSVVVVRPQNVKWFVSVDPEPELGA